MTSKLQVESGKVVSTIYPLPVTFAPSGETPSDTTLTQGSKTVTSSGTPEALGTGTFEQVLIFPLRTNTGDVFFGASSTNDAQHGTLPIVLQAAAGKLINIAGIYLDVTVGGEGVGYIGIK